MAIPAGTNTVISHAIGRGEDEGRRRVTLHAMPLALPCTLAVMVWMTTILLCPDRVPSEWLVRGRDRAAN